MIRRTSTPTILALLVAMGAGAPATVAGQSVLERTPNLTGAWSAPRGVIQFNLLHRFDVTPAPARKLTNSPTLLVAYGFHDRFMLGFNYASASDLVANYPNEWEFLARWLPVDEEEGGPLDVAVQGGYNLATESVDGELLLARTLGPLRFLAAGRILSDGYRTGETRYAVAGGAAIRLREGLSLSGDVSSLVDRADDEEVAWGGALQVGVPYTPHTLSVHATNVNTATLAGTSRGSGTTRWGFEYTIPFTLRRYLPTGSASRDAPPAEEGRGRAPARATRALAGPSDPGLHPATFVSARSPGDTVEVTMAELRYAPEVIEVAPGTTLRWVNDDRLQHTVTADDGSFDSGLLDPDESWERTFEEPGEYTYHCTPHPFMKGKVVVRTDHGASR